MHDLRRKTSHFLLLLLTILSPLTIGTEIQSSSDQVLILDASGSMWGQIDGTHKIEIAREVIGGVIQQLPDESRVGLVAYGHRRKGDCSDIEILTAVAPINKAALTKTINDLNPKGKTPITDSVKQAIGLVRGSDQAANIILVSDGLETCGGDPCKAVSDAKAAGVNFVMHVVGFGIEAGENVSSLECAAQAGGGLYFDAKNADELSAALEQAVEKPPLVSGGYLSIKAIANGELSDVAIHVWDRATGEDVGGGRTYRSEETNPRKLLLAAGRYTATIKALEFKGETVRKLDDIVIVEGETVEHTFDYSSGHISIKAVRNGQLSDASVNITRVGERESIAGGRTYTRDTHNPAIYTLTPGRYDVTVTPLEFKGGTSQVFKNIEVIAGETHQELVDFSSGRVGIKVLINDELGDATVHIARQEDGKSVGGGRTYTTARTNPHHTELAPGRYKITVSPVAFSGGKKKVFENIEIIAGQTHEETAEYTSGTLSLKVTENGQLHDATLSISQAGSNASVTGGRSYKSDKSNPKEFKLAVGRYDATIKSLNIEADFLHKFENIVINKAQPVELSHDFKTAVLLVSALNEAKPVTSKIEVINTNTGALIAQARSRTKPSEFHLPPGNYRVETTALKLPSSKPQEQTITLQVGKTAELVMDFAALKNE